MAKKAQWPELVVVIVSAWTLKVSVPAILKSCPGRCSASTRILTSLTSLGHCMKETVHDVDIGAMGAEAPRRQVPDNRLHPAAGDVVAALADLELEQESHHSCSVHPRRRWDILPWDYL